MCNIQIVSDIVYCENQIHQFFQNQKIGSLLKRSSINKEMEISPITVFRVVFTLIFTGKASAKKCPDDIMMNLS